MHGCLAFGVLCMVVLHIGVLLLGCLAFGVLCMVVSHLEFYAWLSRILECYAWLSRI